MKKVTFLVLFLIGTTNLYAQPGGAAKAVTALTTLQTDLILYLDPVTMVLYVAAAIVGLIGAFRVYNNWQQGKDNVMASATGWFGAMLFLLVANTVVRAMFIS